MTDINIGQLSESINDKADRDLNNTTYTPVNKAGDTMTGVLTVNTTNDSPLQLTGGVTYGTNSSQGISCINSANNRVGRIVFRDDTTTNDIQINGMIYGTNTEKNLFRARVNSSGEIDYSPAQLITTYVNGTSGYNIWSNGYCEQWGSDSTGTGLKTVTLTKTMANTNYCVLAASRTDTQSNGVGVIPYSTTQIELYKANTTAHWMVMGYLASGQY